MPSRSKFNHLSREGLLVPDQPAGAISSQYETIVPTLKWDLPITTDINASYPTGPLTIGPGGAGAASILQTFITPSEWLEERNGFWSSFVITFRVGLTQTTDAAPGTTTFRSRFGGTTICSIARAETAAATNLSCVYEGAIYVQGVDGVTNGHLTRVSHNALFAQPAMADVSVDPAATLNMDSELLFELDIGSSDAGTSIDNVVYHVDFRFKDPSRTNVIHIDG